MSESKSHIAPQQATSWTPPASDAIFYWCLCILGGFYILLIVSMLLADIFFVSTNLEESYQVLVSKEVMYATWLSLLSCCVTTVLSLWVAIPLGYLMSRIEFRGKVLLDTILDIPIFLPPLVVGLSLLVLFRQTPLRYIDDNIFPVTLHIPAVILAQFAVASAFAVRTLRATFDEISPRCEQVALTLGCSRWQAFSMVVFPDAWRGILTAATMAWARSLGEFGPLMIFAGSTRMKTEVLPVSVYLELSAGRIEGAVGISLLMVFVAVLVLVLIRSSGKKQKLW
jgi:molybdate transport system permease protein